MPSKEIEIRTSDYVVELKQDKCIYRKYTYAERNNWHSIKDISLVKSMAKEIINLEEWSAELKSELYQLRDMPNYLSIWRSVSSDSISLDTMIYIYDGHLGGGWYHTLTEQEYEDLHCEQCGDSDSYQWSGTKEELRDIVKDYIEI